MYLYDGIAGIVLFLAKYLDRYQDSSCRQDVEKIYKLAIEKLENIQICDVNKMKYLNHWQQDFTMERVQLYMFI